VSSYGGQLTPDRRLPDKRVMAMREVFWPWDELVAAHAVVLIEDPPAFLNVAALITEGGMIISGRGDFPGCPWRNVVSAQLLLAEVQVGHAEMFCSKADLAIVPDVGVGQA